MLNGKMNNLKYLCTGSCKYHFDEPHLTCGCFVGDSDLDYDDYDDSEKRLAWTDRPVLYWYGWRTLLPVHFGSDEFYRKVVTLGWNLFGQINIALWTHKEHKP